jgi:Trk-type K+ transport systems, membrane components
MNTRAVFRYIGLILQVEAVLMLPALFIGLYCRESASNRAFLITIILSAAIGCLLARLRPSGEIYAREGFVTVSLGWIVMSLAGALPFWLSREIPSFMDCWFETVSGFTTTGASILKEVEHLPYSILYWRSFTHWIGGMGVLVFLLAVVPLTRGSGDTLYLMRAESPGPSVGKLTPTIRQTSRTLYGIYIVMTIVEIVMLIAGGMPPFEAVAHSFGSAGTGGFSVKNASIGAYDSTYLQMVIGVFMALFGVNFSVYYLLLVRQFRSAWKNEEMRLYIGLMLGATAIIAFDIHAGTGSLARSFRDSFFQVSSIMTTTGYATVDFNKWPQLSRFILVLLMIIGASAGSTGGGIKVSRLLILFRHVRQEMQTMLRPRSVHLIRMDGKPLEDEVVRGTTAFFAVYSIICAVSMFLVAFDDFSMESTTTAVLACINNIGPGLDLVGPTGNYSQFSNLSKFVLSLDMLFGRLEIFPMLLLFSPSVWKKRV